MPAAKSSKRRFMLYPIIIVAVVLIVMSVTERGDPKQIASIHAGVTEWCEAAARGEDVRARLPVSDPLIFGRLHDALVAACAPLRDGDGPLEIAVAPGFGPDPGSTLEGRGASHHAVISVAGKQRLGLRFLHVDDAPVIVGYWLPDPADAHADGPTSSIRSRER